MECSQTPIWRELTREKLRACQLTAPQEQIKKNIRQAFDRMAKPLDGLGQFETLFAQIGAIQGREQINLSKRAVLIFCADNGIVAEGVSQSGQEVTLAVAKNMAQQKSAVGKLAAYVAADTIPIDIGMCTAEPLCGVLDEKIMHGTNNFRLEPAMSEAQALQAISTGIRLVADCKEKGYALLATGEMGIGNTTTSSAVAAALLGCSAAEVTGRGAGLDDARLHKKQAVITEALERYALCGADALRVLSAVGGLDLAGLAGVCIGGAYYHVPIVLDGVISLAAALVAERLVPGTAAYLLASHKGKEPAAARLLQALGLYPVIDARLALGEGTGAVLLFALLDLVQCLYEDGTTFAQMQLAPYQRYFKEQESV